MFKNYEKKKYYKSLIKKIQRSIFDMELRIITISEIREGIRSEFDRVSAVIKDTEQQIEKIQENNDVKNKFQKVKENYAADAENLKNQMMGKWNEKEQRYIGGLDQEIEMIEEKIQGGKEFQGLIKRELKKL